MANSFDRIEPGAIVGGGYKLIKALGRGAFGEVWKAEAPGGVEAAMKIIIRPLTEKNAQIERNALELTKKLRHGFLLQTHGFWATDDRLYIAMELADGCLRERFKQCRNERLPGIPVEELLPYIEQSAKALDYLHGKHLVHRDIKPENILRLGDIAKVADFGLAAALPEETTQSATIQSAGTSHYMGPEVWSNRAYPASDQWSLAVTYVELRLGQVLFSGEGLAGIMISVLNSAPNLTGLEPDEQDVLRQALAKEHFNRFPSCTAFTDALRDALSPKLAERKSSGARSGPRPIIRPATGEMTTRPTSVQPGGGSGSGIKAVPGSGRKSGPFAAPPPEPAPSSAEGYDTVTNPAVPRPPSHTQASPGSAVRTTPAAASNKAVHIALGVVAAIVALGGVGAWWAVSGHREPSTEIAVQPPQGGNQQAAGKGNGPAPNGGGAGNKQDVAGNNASLPLDDLLKKIAGPPAGRGDLDTLLKDVLARLDAKPADDFDSVEKVATALTSAKLPAERVGYIAYVEGVREERKKARQPAADAYVRAFKKPTPAGLSVPERQKRVASFLESAGHSERSVEPFAFDMPFKTPDKVERVYGWLSAAYDLRTAGGEVGVSLRADLALAAWYLDKRRPEDVAQVVELTGSLLPPPDPKAMPDLDLVALWTVRAAALAKQNPNDPREAFKAYRQAWDAASKLPASSSNQRAVSLVGSILAPQAELGIKVAADNDPEEKTKVAEVLAEEARLIRDHSRAKWQFPESPAQKVFDLYQRASDYDKGKPMYYAERGKARLHLLPTADPRTELTKARSDAGKATALDPKFAGALELKGLVDLWLSRIEVNGEEQRKLLREAIDEYEKAIALTRQKNPLDGELPVLLTNSSTACLELGNFSPKERVKYLKRARDEAADAILPKYELRSLERKAEAQLALGHALEDIGWLTETDVKQKAQRYREAIEAFDQSLSLQEDDPGALIARGRTRVRLVRDAGGDVAKELPAARTDLQSVLEPKLKADPVQQAWAHDWLAWAALAQSNPTDAANQFAETAKLIDPKSPPLVTYALISVEGFKTEAEAGKSPPVLARAARNRLKKLTGLKGDAEAARVTALAWSDEVEGRLPQEALDELGQSIPSDIRLWTAEHLPLILARGDLQLRHDKKLQPAPSWTAVCSRDVKRALELAERPEVPTETRARANAFAGFAWDRRLTEAGVAKAPLAEQVQAARQSVAGFEKAVSLQPDTRPALGWRYQLACNMDYVAGVDEDVKKDAKVKCEMIRKARQHLKMAREMTTPDDGKWRKEIDEELARQKKYFPDCVDD